MLCCRVTVQAHAQPCDQHADDFGYHQPLEPPTAPGLLTVLCCSSVVHARSTNMGPSILVKAHFLFLFLFSAIVQILSYTARNNYQSPCADQYRFSTLCRKLSHARYSQHGAHTTKFPSLFISCCISTMVCSTALNIHCSHERIVNSARVCSERSCQRLLSSLRTSNSCH